MRKYPNLPGVSLYLIDGGERINIDSGLPKTLVFGVINEDYFGDEETPIQFNEPYVIPDVKSISEMFGSSGSLFNAITKVYQGSGNKSSPMAVRVGYPVYVPENLPKSAYTLKNGTNVVPLYTTQEVTNESLTPGSTATLAAGDIVPGTVTVDVTFDAGGDPLVITDNSQGDLSDGGSINYLTGQLTFATVLVAADTVKAAYTKNIAGAYPTINVKVDYQPSFNGHYVVKVSEVDSAVYKGGSENALEGVKVDFSWNGGNTFDYKGLSMGQPIYIKEVGITVTFNASLATALLTTASQYSFSIQVRKVPANNDEMYKALTDAYEIIDGVDAAVVTVADVYLDSKFTDIDVAVHAGDPDKKPGLTKDDISFGYQLARFAQDTSIENRMCIGVIGVTEPPAYNLAATNKWANDLVNLNGFKDGFYKTVDGTMTGTALFDEAGKPIDLGANLIVIPAWGKVPGFANTVDASTFIGTYMIYQGGDQLINLAIPRIALTYTLTKKVTDMLLGAKYCPIYSEFQGAFKVSKVSVARMAAGADSSFTKLSTVKVVNEVAENLRSVSKKYLGRPNSPQIREAMKSEMETVLKAGASLGKYADAIISVKSDGSDTVLGIVNVYCRLLAYAEIHRVDIYLKYEYANQDVA